MNDPVVFKFSTAVLAIPFAVAALGVVAMIACWLKGKRTPALALLALAMFSGLLIGPMMVADRVRVWSDHVEQTTGFLWSPTKKGFRYEDVSFVHVTQKPQGPQGDISLVWEIHENDGSLRDIDLGDLWEANSEEITALLKKYGVKFR